MLKLNQGHTTVVKRVTVRRGRGGQKKLGVGWENIMRGSMAKYFEGGWQNNVLVGWQKF